MNASRPLAFCCLFLCLSSCSVKENRWECPLFLHFEKVENPHGCSGDVVVLGFAGDGTRGRLDERHSLESLLDEGNLLPIPKGGNIVSMIVVEGASVGSVVDGEYLIPDGQQMDRVFALADEFDCGDEDYYMEGSLLRQFASVSLTMSYIEGEDFPFDLTVVGPSAGFDARTLQPASGNLNFAPKQSSDGVFRFNLPRQYPGSWLCLELWSPGQGGTRATGGPVHTVILSDYLKKAGYDWNAPDLEEVSLFVDYANCSISVEVGDWREVYEMNVVI